MNGDQTIGLMELVSGLHIFKDRAEAGAQLAERLEAYRAAEPLVLGIPPGGVPVGAEVARRLGADLDILVARTLRARTRPEFALGAITVGGSRCLNHALVRQAGVGEEYLEALTAHEIAEARLCEEHFRGRRASPRIQGRIVIVVDDGGAKGDLAIDRPATCDAI
jgi:putative phosphoribosyl transferase